MVDQAELDRALNYPYDVRAEPFEFDVASGVVTSLRTLPADAGGGRRPVLAVGSNAAPQQLARKFRGSGLTGSVLVVPCALAGSDVVYSARITPYGASPATTVPSPGTAAQVWLTFFDDAQRALVDGTEGLGAVYDAVEVDVGLVACEVGFEGPLVGYVARCGPLLVDGSPLALAAVGAERRVFPAVTEAEVLGQVAVYLGTDVESLVRDALASKSFRLDVNRSLAEGITR
jgi:hypothetical protein